MIQAWLAIVIIIGQAIVAYIYGWATGKWAERLAIIRRIRARELLGEDALHERRLLLDDVLPPSEEHK